MNPVRQQLLISGTIRGAVAQRPQDNIEDYKSIPKYPVWGLGDGFNGISPMMYLQVRYHFKKWWVDLTRYDNLGMNTALVSPEKDFFEDMGPMTENMLWVWQTFCFHIP